jgi:hypothetical protein
VAGVLAFAWLAPAVIDQLDRYGEIEAVAPRAFLPCARAR